MEGGILDSLALTNTASHLRALDGNVIDILHVNRAAGTACHIHFHNRRLWTRAELGPGYLASGTDEWGRIRTTRPIQAVAGPPSMARP